MDRIDPCLHIVKARILEDTLPLIRWMRCGDRAAAAEEEAEEEEDGDEVKKGEEEGGGGGEGDRRWRNGQTGSSVQAGPIHQPSQSQ